MVQKYNFSEIGAATDPMSGLFIFLNGTHHLIFYAALLIISIVTFYIFLRKTQDIAKSSLSSLHIVVFISLLIFFWGLTIGQIFLPELFILSLIVIEILSITAVYYSRSKGF